MKPAPLIDDSRWYDIFKLLIPVFGWIWYFESIDDRTMKRLDKE